MKSKQLNDAFVRIYKEEIEARGWSCEAYHSKGMELERIIYNFCHELLKCKLPLPTKIAMPKGLYKELVKKEKPNHILQIYFYDHLIQILEEE